MKIELTDAMFDVNPESDGQMQTVRGFIAEIQGFQVGLFFNGTPTGKDMNALYVDIQTGILIGQQTVYELEKEMLVNELMDLPTYAALLVTSLIDQSTAETLAHFTDVHARYDAVTDPPRRLNTLTVTLKDKEGGGVSWS